MAINAIKPNLIEINPMVADTNFFLASCGIACDNSSDLCHEVTESQESQIELTAGIP